MDATTDNLPTALVLAGGGSFGAVQVGMLRALVAHGLVPGLVVGSSVGAINGVHFASAPDANGVSSRRSGAACAAARSSRSGGAVLGLLRRGFAVDPRGLRRLVERHLSYQTFDQVALPLHLVATDLLAGGTVCLSSGPVVEAVLASCAIPAAFPPVCIGERYLIDGAVACNTPISIAVELGAKPLMAPPALAGALHAITLMIAHQLVTELERYRDQAEIVTVPPLCPLEVSPYDFSRAGELIERAAMQTQRWLDHGGFTRERVPQALRAHTH